MNQIEPIASKIPYMVAVGNHEFKEYVSSRNNTIILVVYSTMSITILATSLTTGRDSVCQGTRRIYTTGTKIGHKVTVCTCQS